MRGKVVQLFDLLLRVRITPAYAGKSQRHADTADRHEDHPRLCGEKALLRCVVCGRRGSPPPMRGKVITTCTNYKLVRITPAYAGKSL